MSRRKEWAAVAEAWFLARAWKGRYLLFNGDSENSAGAQCVNVINEYRRGRGLEPQWGNAGDWYGNPMSGYHWIGKAEGRPRRSGDVLVWPASADRPEGHVALVVESLSPSQCLVAMQNDPDGSPVTVERITVGGSMGLHRLDTQGA